MTIQRYEIFNKVVQLQSITRTGIELNLTQSAVSRAIKSLEDELDLQLLLRNRSGIKLTREGEKIYEHTLTIIHAHHNLQQEALALNGLESGVIKVGTFASVTTHWLPTILKEFKRKHPDIIVEIFEDDYESLENAVQLGELDCCFTTAPIKKGLEFLPLHKDKLFCIVSNNNPLHLQTAMCIQQLEEFPLIKPKKGWDSEVITFFNKHNIDPNVKYEVSDDQSIIALVQANIGINIRPELVLKNTPDGITALEFEEEAYRIIGLGITKQASHATRSFISIVKEMYQTI
ncbi:LysR substrate-binding domain-containing protein [Sporosarcina sp. ACRSM]|uniref:LysR substrate-binding domain-containing protein n=1 Tax=Sporosarcina soli TaxID=334736 RepID=A0ABW0TKM7_9BACL|nr:LysR family transcriptional regulator [Sporosarcina sp. ACRSM]MCG7334831.1 LysR substrate-binding domain-containing protein [Sporosarcina sp. ACRSM]